MRTFSIQKIALFLFIILFAGTAAASCRTKTVVYHPRVVYATPVAAVYKDAPSPAPMQTTSYCGSCGIMQQERTYVPAHWAGNKYEEYYDTPNTFPNRYTYDDGEAYIP
jgi:hypothetical protein